MVKKIKVLGPYNTWQVTTEGDCEGRSVRNLGTHTGFIDDIAFALADKAYYGLRFVPIEPTVVDGSAKTGSAVNVSLDIDTGTWDMTEAERTAYFKVMLHGRDTVVVPGQYHACVILRDGTTPEEQLKAQRRAVALVALAKLSKEEREALGV